VWTCPYYQAVNSTNVSLTEEQAALYDTATTVVKGNNPSEEEP
jgi:hypothetical protein